MREYMVTLAVCVTDGNGNPHPNSGGYRTTVWVEAEDAEEAVRTAGSIIALQVRS
jgi:hypothetical protein